jgi:hypothetical protein
MMETRTLDPILSFIQMAYYLQKSRFAEMQSEHFERREKA